jgi:hypothetical protein
MNFENWISSKVNSGQEATISLALLERLFHSPPEVPELRAIEFWARGICHRIGCTASIYVSDDVITFYPR